MFHALCLTCADTLVGTTGAKPSGPAWRQTYRAIEHGHSKKQCGNAKVMVAFPQGIQDVANTFRLLQEKRHEADYDPASRFALTDTVGLIDAAETAMKALWSAPMRDRRAFAVWVLLKDRL